MRFLGQRDPGKIARLDGIALVEANGKVECYLIEDSDAAGFRLKAKRRLFEFEADDSMAPADWRLKESAPPDFWHNAAVTELTQRLDRDGRAGYKGNLYG